MEGSPVGTISDYDTLGKQTGKSFTVYRQGRESMRVEIVRVTERGDILVRRRFGGGKVEFALDRRSFDRAEE